MKNSLYIILAGLLTYSLDASSVDTIIINSVMDVGRNPAEVGIVFDTITKDGELTLHEKEYVLDGVPIALTITSLNDSIVQLM